MEKVKAARRIIGSLDKKYWKGIHERINYEDYKDCKELGKDIDDLVRELQEYFSDIKGKGCGMDAPSSSLIDALIYCRDECRKDGNDVMKIIEGPLKVVEYHADFLERELKSLYDI